MSEASCLIQVYLDDGRVFEYRVAPEKAREHSHAIVMTGYRHAVPATPTDEALLEHYPPHRISKVKVTGPGVSTMYSDTVRGT